MAFEPDGEFVTNWSWTRPFVNGVVYVVEDMDLRGDRMMMAWNMLEQVCEHRRWFCDASLVFESFDDAVAFRLGFDTGPIKEITVEAS